MENAEFLDEKIYSTDLFIAEKEAAYFLYKLLKRGTQKVSPLTDGLKHRQPEAVEMACTQPVSILTGPPGTGKTTTAQKIIDSFIAAGMRGVVLCPYGKAAKRADEVINKNRSFYEKVQCSTVHFGLQWSQEGFLYNRENRFPYDFVFVDEFSTLDIFILRDLLEAIDPNRTRIVFCGDQYQLPSVGPGNVARDMIQSKAIPAVELDVVLRTGPKSGITYNANMILRGHDIAKENESGEKFEDFYFVSRSKEQDTCNSIVKYITEDIPSHRKLNPLTEIMLLCPGKISFCGVKNMNRVLRDALIKNQSEKVGGFCKDDKVIHLKNDRSRNLVNGDVGFVKEVVRGKSGSHIVVDFGDKTGPKGDGIVELKGELLDRITHAYALTVHRAQGSEFPACIMPIHACHTILLTRNLTYTGLTRAKTLGIMLGDIEVLRRAIKNNRPEQRQTELKNLLAA